MHNVCVCAISYMHGTEVNVHGAMSVNRACAMKLHTHSSNLIIKRCFTEKSCTEQTVRITYKKVRVPDGKKDTFCCDEQIEVGECT